MRRRRLRDGLGVDVSHHADDREPVPAIGRQPLADRTLAPEELVGERAAYHGATRGRVVEIGHRECPALQHRNSRCREVAGRDEVLYTAQRLARRVQTLYHGRILEMLRDAAEEAAFQRQALRCANRADPRQSGNDVLHVLQERPPAAANVVVRHEVDLHHATRIDARIRNHEIAEARQQQAGTDQQHERQGDLCHDQERPRTLTGSARGRASTGVREVTRHAAQSPHAHRNHGQHQQQRDARRQS